MYEHKKGGGGIKDHRPKEDEIKNKKYTKKNSITERQKSKGKKKDANWLKTKPVCKLHMGIFIHSSHEHFPLSFLTIVGKKHFSGSREKTFKPYQFFFSHLPLTKHLPKIFSLHFSLFHCPFSLKSS